MDLLKNFLRVDIAEAIEMVTRAEDEGFLYACMMEIRDAFEANPVAGLNSLARDEALTAAHATLSQILPEILKRPSEIDGKPGHGLGHWTRDYVHAIFLAHDPELDPRFILPCVLGGALHDIGTLFVDRYADKNRVVRHAEVGALIFLRVAIESTLSFQEAITIAYTIAAHTHYLSEREVRCRDGEMRKIIPYLDVVNGKPLLHIWLPRWADRLDCSGAAFVGRHYFTLLKDHRDFGTDGFYSVRFNEHMQPRLRSARQIQAEGGSQTMAEHCRMFADSQTRHSPYGWYDQGRMVGMRNRYRQTLMSILEAIEHPSRVSPDVMKAWTVFLSLNIEPSLTGALTAERLRRRFEYLDEETQCAWSAAFHLTMTQYMVQTELLLSFMHEIPDYWHRLAGIKQDVRNVIRPHDHWRHLL